MLEKLFARLGLVPAERLAEMERERDLALIEADRERGKRAAAEDALIIERAARPAGVTLTTREQIAVINSHLDAIHARADRLVAHG